MARWLLAALALGAFACGDGDSSDGGSPPPDDGGGGGGPSCVPSTCEVLGATCGTLADGCGGALACGDCPAGQSCGAGGRPNVCAAVSSCSPATCASLEKDCGPVPDGCGGVLDCGACTGGEVCGAGGAANVCAAPPASCAPATCASLGKDCGSVPDGCGRDLACGACGDGESCGAGGTLNVCAPLPAEPDVRWFARFGGPGDEVVTGVAVDDAGRRFALSHRTDWSSGRQELFLRRYGADGAEQLVKRFEGRPYFGFQLRSSPSGELLVHVSGACFECTGAGFDFGGGEVATNAETLVALGADGAFRWQVRLDEGVASLAAAPDGGAVVGTYLGDVRRLGPDGAVVWSVPGELARWCAVDGSGDAVCGFALSFERPTVTRVQKLARSDGAVVWTRDVTGLLPALWLATSDQGTVAILGWRTGDIDLGPEPVREGGMALVVLERDGRPRWARGLEYLNGAALTVDPTGRVAALGTQSACGALAVHAFMLGGARLWSRTLPTDGACWTGVGFSGAAAYGRDHALTVGGWFWGTLRIGDERLQPEGSDGLVVNLSP